MTTSQYEMKIRIAARDSEAVSQIMRAARANGEVTKVTIAKVVTFSLRDDAEDSE